MPKPANKLEDVFKFINMHGGDKTVCWEWTRESKGGGRDNRPYFDVDGRKTLAYRIVYELVHGVRIPPRKMMCHSCDNPRCCNPYHVRPCDHVENMNDMKTRQRHGLTHHAVKAIRKQIEQGKLTQQQIADMWGVSRESISAIKNERIYTHVKSNDEKEESNDG
ncbi:hypothetical protein HC928_05035 [bacterium]|nr:hypothetical protein [bacterium]